MVLQGQGVGVIMYAVVVAGGDQMSSSEVVGVGVHVGVVVVVDSSIARVVHILSFPASHYILTMLRRVVVDVMAVCSRSS